MVGRWCKDDRRMMVARMKVRVVKIVVNIVMRMVVGWND